MIYVGDEEKDIIGANSVGVVSVLVDRDGKRPQFAKNTRSAAFLKFFPSLNDPSMNEESSSARKMRAFLPAAGYLRTVFAPREMGLLAGPFTLFSPHSPLAFFFLTI
jgi:hypothetical protein